MTITECNGMWQISAPAPRYRDRISFLFDMSWIHFSNEKEWGNQKTVNTTQHTHNIHKHLTAATFSRINLCTLVYHPIRMKKKQKTKAKNGLAWGHRIYICASDISTRIRIQQVVFVGNRNWFIVESMDHMSPCIDFALMTKK